MEWNFSHLSASFPWLYSTMSLAAVMHALHSRPHISYPCNAKRCYRQQKVWFSTWMLPLLEGPCFWQSYHKLQGHCQGFSINRSWCALHASLMVGSFLLHAAISGGRDGPMLQGCHPRCHHHFGGLASVKQQQQNQCPQCPMFAPPVSSSASRDNSCV